jgi:hypothetical protein
VRRRPAFANIRALAGAQASADDARPLELDKETRRRLKALGYLK